MNERLRIGALAGLIALTASGCLETTPPPTPIVEPTRTPELEQKPNIVVIMLDDVNPIDGRLWTKERMPTVSATFVEGGINFEEFYGETPLCCPGRVAILTGQHTQNHGVLDNNSPYPVNFNPGTTLATELQDAGYYTMIIGKYLNTFRSFKDKTPVGWTNQAIFNLKNSGFDYGLITRSGEEPYGSSEEDYSTDILAKKAVEYISKVPKNQPIFVYIAPNATHAPHTPAPRYKNDPRCKDIEPWRPPSYGYADIDDPAYLQTPTTLDPVGYDLTKVCESILAVDDLVRSVKEELKREGRLENTIFVFTADNGMAWGDHGLTEKRNPYSTKLPLLISWDNNIEPRNDNTVLSNIDVAPTLAEAAGTEMGPYPNGQKKADGISFYSLLLDPEANPNKDTNRDLVLESEPTRGRGMPIWWGIRTTEAFTGGNYRFISYETGEVQLYDLNKDPNQLDNIAYEPENQELVSYFTKRLDELKQTFSP